LYVIFLGHPKAILVTLISFYIFICYAFVEWI